MYLLRISFHRFRFLQRLPDDHEETEFSSGVPFDPVSQEIYDRFDVGKVYANSEIQQKIRDIPGVPSEMSPNKVSRELRDRFKTEEDWVEGNRGHEILSKGGCLPKSPKKMDGSASSSETPNRTGLPDFLQ